MPPPKLQPAPPFANRELNGEVLLEELAELRTAQVTHKHLVDCVAALRELAGLRLTEASPRLKQLSSTRLAAQPSLAALLTRWATRLKTDVDVPLLLGHFERLAVAQATFNALRRAAERLPKGGRG